MLGFFVSHLHSDFVLQESVSFSCMRKFEWLGENKKQKITENTKSTHFKITEKMLALKKSYKTLIL